jgi:hypothetical protein
MTALFAGANKFAAGQPTWDDALPDKWLVAGESLLPDNDLAFRAPSAPMSWAFLRLEKNQVKMPVIEGRAQALTPGRVLYGLRNFRMARSSSRLRLARTRMWRMIVPEICGGKLSGAL